MSSLWRQYSILRVSMGPTERNMRKRYFSWCDIDISEKHNYKVVETKNNISLFLEKLCPNQPTPS